MKPCNLVTGAVTISSTLCGSTTGHSGGLIQTSIEDLKSAVHPHKENSETTRLSNFQNRSVTTWCALTISIKTVKSRQTVTRLQGLKVVLSEVSHPRSVLLPAVKGVKVAENDGISLWAD
jgi:hypothetical protein